MGRNREEHASYDLGMYGVVADHLDEPRAATDMKSLLASHVRGGGLSIG